MKRIVRRAAAGTALASALMATSAFAGGTAPVQQIDFGDSFFSPANPPPFGVSVSAREVDWFGTSTTLPHNVHQDKRLFRSGDPSEDFDEFQTNIAAGKYHYYCQVHGSKSGGMDGLLKIRPSLSPADGESIAIRWADPEAEARHRYRVEFRRVGANRWKVWKKGTAQTQGRFGANNKPVNANPNRDYQVRVRTFVRGNKNRRSGWSPKVTFSVAP